MIYLKLYWEFFKIGLFSIGGGMATVPFLQHLGKASGWFSSAELANMIAISESTPGPIGVNMATYVGNTTSGVLGGVVATLGLVTPSIIIILIIATILDKFRKNKYVDAAFYGLRASSVGLIAAAGVAITLIAFFGIESIFDITKIHLNWIYVALAAVILILTRFVKATKKLHPICFIIFSAIVGVLLKL